MDLAGVKVVQRAVGVGEPIFDGREMHETAIGECHQLRQLRPGKRLVAKRLVAPHRAVLTRGGASSSSPAMSRARLDQGRTLLAMVSAVCLTGKIRSLAIAQTLARETKVRCKSALQRFYRFVNKSKLDPLAVWKGLTEQLLVACRRVAVISIDWSEWRFDLRCLVASLALGRRSVPVFAQSKRRMGHRITAGMIYTLKR